MYKAKLYFILTTILIFYFWTASRGTYHFNLHGNHGSFYNLQTNALLMGKLNLLISPPKGLLELPNPYDIVANKPFRQLEIGRAHV